MILKNVKLTIANEKGVILGHIDISGKNLGFNSYHFSPEIQENLNMVDEISLHSELLRPIQTYVNRFNTKHSIFGKG